MFYAVTAVYALPYLVLFFLICSCDAYAIGKVSLEGEMVAENPYGHLPATQYSSLPFYSYMTIIYVVVLIMWGMLCIQYSKEIMSVHIIILVCSHNIIHSKPSYLDRSDCFCTELLRESPSSVVLQHLWLRCVALPHRGDGCVYSHSHSYSDHPRVYGVGDDRWRDRIITRNAYVLSIDWESAVLVLPTRPSSSPSLR